MKEQIVRVRVLDAATALLRPNGGGDSRGDDVYCKVMCRGTISKRSSPGLRGPGGIVKFDEWLYFEVPEQVGSEAKIKTQLFRAKRNEKSECIGQTDWIDVFSQGSGYSLYRCDLTDKSTGGIVGTASVEVKTTPETTQQKGPPIPPLRGSNRHSQQPPSVAYLPTSDPEVVTDMLNCTICVMSLLCWVNVMDSLALYSIGILLMGYGTDTTYAAAASGAAAALCVRSILRTSLSGPAGKGVLSRITGLIGPLLGYEDMRSSLRRSRKHFGRDNMGLISKLAALRDLSASLQHHADAALHTVFSIGWGILGIYHCLTHRTKNRRKGILLLCSTVVLWMQVALGTPILPLLLVCSMTVCPLAFSWSLQKERIPYLPEFLNLTPEWLNPAGGVGLRLVQRDLAFLAEGGVRQGMIEREREAALHGGAGSATEATPPEALPAYPEAQPRGASGGAGSAEYGSGKGGGLPGSLTDLARFIPFTPALGESDQDHTDASGFEGNRPDTARSNDTDMGNGTGEEGRRGGGGGGGGGGRFVRHTYSNSSPLTRRDVDHLNLSVSLGQSAFAGKAPPVRSGSGNQQQQQHNGHSSGSNHNNGSTAANASPPTKAGVPSVHSDPRAVHPRGGDGRDSMMAVPRSKSLSHSHHAAGVAEARDAAAGGGVAAGGGAVCRPKEDSLEFFCAVAVPYPEGKDVMGQLKELHERKMRGQESGKVFKHDITHAACNLLHIIASQFLTQSRKKHTQLHRLFLIPDETRKRLEPQVDFRLTTTNTAHLTKVYVPLNRERDLSFPYRLNAKGQPSRGRVFEKDLQEVLSQCTNLYPVHRGYRQREVGGEDNWKDILVGLSYIAAELFSPRVSVVFRTVDPQPMLVIMTRVKPQANRREAQRLTLPESFHPEFNKALIHPALLRQLMICACNIETTLQALLDQLANAKYVYYRSSDTAPFELEDDSDAKCHNEEGGRSPPHPRSTSSHAKTAIRKELKGAQAAMRSVFPGIFGSGK